MWVGGWAVARGPLLGSCGSLPRCGNPRCAVVEVYFSDFTMVGSLFCLCVLGAAASSGDIRAAANRLEAAGPVSRAALRDAELDILIQSGEKSAAEVAPKDGCVKVRGGGGSHR